MEAPAMTARKLLLTLSVLSILSASNAFANYHPEEGRWISRDPIEESGGVHLYGFVDNNPVSNWDYLGLACCCGGVEITYSPGGDDFQWGIYDFARNFKRVGNKIHVKWTVFGDDPTDCAFRQVEEGLLAVYDKKPGGEWQFVMAKEGKAHVVSQEYDDALGADLGLAEMGFMRKFQMNMKITFECLSSIGAIADEAKTITINGTATAKKGLVAWFLDESVDGPTE